MRGRWRGEMPGVARLEKELGVIHTPEELDTLPELDGRVFIIGGSKIYAAFLPRFDELLVSHVFENFQGDTRFPEFERLFPHSELLETHEAFEVKRWSR